MLKRLMLFGVLALTLAAPAQAEGWRVLKVRGVVVSASAEVVTVENLVGDALLRCRVPERLAEEAAALKPGDKVRMLCHRKRGERAVLHRLERLGEHAEKRGEKSGEKSDEKTRERPEKKPEHADKRASATARGLVVELADDAIVVQDAESGKRLACKVPDSKAHKLEGVKVGDRVEIHCANNQLAYLKRPEAAKRPEPAEAKLLGTITALSATSVSVTGDGRTLTCSIPASFAEKMARFAVGANVKMMCRGTELTYLEKV